MEGQFKILFDKMKIEIQNQTTELKETITKSILDKMDEKLMPLVEENENLKIKVQELEKKIEFIKRSERKNNIIIFGLKENETSTSELLLKFKENLKEDLNIKVEDYEVNNIHRIGKINRESDKPRPVLCSFVNNWKKYEIVKNKNNLKNIYLTEDYSKEVLEKRKKLQTQLVEERKKGNIAYLKYDRLIIKENNDSQEKRKREASASPSYTIQPKKQQSLFLSTPNKVNAFDIMQPKSKSLFNISTAKKQ